MRFSEKERGKTAFRFWDREDGIFGFFPKWKKQKKNLRQPQWTKSPLWSCFKAFQTVSIFRGFIWTPQMASHLSVLFSIFEKPNPVSLENNRFQKIALIWPSCKICIKKASSHRDLLALRTLVPGIGLEPIWIIHSRDFKPSYRMFH